MMRRSRKTRSRIITIILLTLSLAIIASSVPPKQAGIISNDKSTPRQPSQTTSPPANALSTGAYFDHVVVIVMENQGIYDICGPNPGGSPPCNGSNTPYLDSLANSSALALNYTSVYTPQTSAPNYVAMIGGSTFNCSSGGCGGPGIIVQPDIVDRLGSANLTWKAYFENYPQPFGCVQGSSEPYNNIHNPFIWFSDIYHNQTRCGQLVNANPPSCTTTDCMLINDLNGANPPNFAWLTPNDCNDMHGNSTCTANGCLGTSSTYVTICEKDGDAYLKTLVPNILNSTIFKTQRSALFITFDEGINPTCLPNSNHTHGDCVPAIWSGPAAKTGYVVPHNRYNHYSALKTLEANWNLSSLEINDTNASPMTEFLNLPDFSISTSPNSLTLGQPSSAVLPPAAVTTSGDKTWFESSYLSDSFSAQGRIWLFYEDNRTTCEHHHGCLLYTTSSNGSSWATPLQVNNNAGQPLHVSDSDYSVYSNATYVFYVRYNQTSFQSACNREFYVRQGKLSAAGTVAWNPEIKVLSAAPWQTYDNTYITMDSTGQLWLGYLITSKTTCGGNGTEVPVVLHSSGMNYTSWTGNFNLTTEKNNIWNVALVSLGSGQMYASFWIKHYSLHGRLYDPNANPMWSVQEDLISNQAGTTNGSTGLCSGGACLDVNAWTFASGSTVYDLYFDNSTKDYYVATRSNGVWNSPGTLAAFGDRYTGYDCCGTGNTYFNTAWYSLPDAASFNNGIFYLYYLQGSNGTIDQWSGGSGGAWTKTNGIFGTTSAPYPDSITSFVTFSPTNSSLSTVGVFFVNGSSPGPYTYNYASLPLGSFSSTSTFTIAVTSLSGFAGTVKLSPTITPSAGLNASCNPTSITGGSGSSTCSLIESTAGNYTVRVTGTSGNLSHGASLVVRAVDFSIVTSVTSLVAPVGSSASTEVTLTSLNGYSGNINLNVTVLSPPQTFAGGGGRHPLAMTPMPCPPISSINPNSTTLVSRGSRQSTLTIAPSFCVLAGNYPVNIAATDGIHTHSVQLTMIATDFSITSPTNNVSVPAGSNSTLTLSLQGLNGFQGSISLSTIVTPSGPSATLSPNIVLLSAYNSSLLTIIVPSSTSPGDYTLSIQAASGNLIHSIIITVMVSTASVGGLIIPIDKLGLAIQLLPTGTSILIVLASALASVGTARKRSKRRIPSHNLRKAGVQERHCSTTFVHSTTIGPFWKPARQSERW